MQFDFLDFFKARPETVKYFFIYNLSPLQFALYSPKSDASHDTIQALNIKIHSLSLAVTPDSLSVISSNATSLEVAWQPSKVYDKNGDIQGYVMCPREKSLITCQMNKTYAEQYERTKWIEGLNPYTEYFIDITTYNVAGQGSPISVLHRTEQAGSSF